MNEMRFRSNGKLMITGEYLVLGGASALAIPVIYGQTLTVKISPQQKPELSWVAKEQGKPWFEAVLKPDQLSQDAHQMSMIEQDERVQKTLEMILWQAKMLNPGFLSGNYHWAVSTDMDFNRYWGLGSSSSLISNIAWWAGVDPYDLLFKTLGGSGYDVACARSFTPIVYKYKGVGSKPVVEPVLFTPPFSKHLFFVYTGKKQSSAKSLKGFQVQKVKEKFIDRITQITEIMLNTNSLHAFMELMFEHEHITSQAIDQLPVQLETYPDFDGAIKSLGAWGGDFIMAASGRDKKYVSDYFEAIGLQLVIPFDEMIVNK